MTAGTGVTICTPYPEGAALALVRHFEAQGELRAHFFATRPQAAVAARLPELLRRRFPATTRAAGRLSTNGHCGIGVAPAGELVRLAAVASRRARLRREAMYWQARSFDRAVASQVHYRRSAGRRVVPSALIGLPGACLETFRALRGSGCITVFHAVNAHPSEHNRLLLDVYSRDEAENELIPAATALRVEAELALADLVLVPSHLVRAQMIVAGVAAERIVVQPYGVDAKFWTTSTDDLPMLARQRPHALFVGQVGLRKGLPFLIAAARIARNTDLTIIGPVVDKTVLRDLPVNVRYLGPLAAAEVRDHMWAADAFVLPTVEDACALVIAEAASTGLPIITTPMNGASEIVSDTLKTIVPAALSEPLAQALREVAVLSRADRLANAATSRTGGGMRDWATYCEAIGMTINERIAKAF